jgi:serine/threonine protein kinase
MELVDGPDLAEFLRAAPRPFDVRLALNLTRGIAEGLGAAHALGLVHRDIKPYNILMERHETDWTPKITGFGTFVAVTSSQMHAGTAGGVMLTAPYAAPEQWGVIPPLDLDGRTDFYGLGGVLFEMLTGETVFAAEDFPGWSELHQHAAPRPLSSVRPDLAQWKGLDALVLRMLAKDREDRPQNASELLSLLDAISNVPQPRRVTVREEPTP